MELEAPFIKYQKEQLNARMTRMTSLLDELKRFMDMHGDAIVGVPPKLNRVLARSARLGGKFLGHGEVGEQ